MSAKKQRAAEKNTSDASVEEAEAVESTKDASVEQGDTVAGGGSTGDANDQPAKTVGAVIGEMAWLLSQSKVHRYNLFVGDLEWLVMPPVMHNQYRLFYKDGQPVGCALWAFVDETVEQRLSAGGRIAAGEWRSGDRVWLVELIAPFGQQEAMLEDLTASALADRRFHFQRTNAQGKRETVTMDGKEVPGTA